MGITYGKKDKVFRQYGKPSLLLDFARRKKLLDTVSKKNPITFTRASSVATYVDADGLIKKAPVNNLLYSEQFDNGYWQKSNLTIDANAATAPDGKQTADLYKANASNSLFTPIFTSSTKSYTASFYMKAVSANTWVRIGYQSSLINGAWFDLNAGVAGTVNTASNSSKIEYIGNGWYRCSLTLNSGADTAQNLFVALSDGDGVFTTSGGEKIYIWGAQLEETDPATMAPTEYIKTTSTISGAPRFDHEPTSGNVTTNLLKYSEMFDQSVWMQAAGANTITANSQTAPNDEQTADLMSFTSSDYTGRAQSVTGISGTTYTFSVYIKRISGSGTGRIEMYGANVITGTAATFTATTSWQRIQVTGTATGTGNFNVYIYPEYLAGRTGSYALWGAQLEIGTTAGTYVRTLGETRSISDARAESKGLLIEEARTNLSPNGSIVAGTGWSVQSSYGRILNYAISPDGKQDATYFADADSQTDPDLYAYDSFTIGTNKTITHSIYVKSPNQENVGKEVVFRGKRFTGTSTVWSDTFTLTNQWQRVYVTHTYQSDNTSAGAYIGANPNTTHPAGAATELLVWGLQVEEGSFPTSYIPTNGSTVQRTADIATVEGNDFKRTNLIGYSQDFNNTGWTYNQYLTPVANATIAPDGTQTAYLAIPNTNSAVHYFKNATFINLNASTRYTYTVYAKAGGYGSIRFHNLTTSGAPRSGRYNLIDGTVDQDNMYLPYGGFQHIESVGNGWYKCIFSFGTHPTYTAMHFEVLPLSASLGTYGSTYAGDGLSGVYFWGAQLERSDYPTDYIPTTTTSASVYNWYNESESSMTTDFIHDNTGGALLGFRSSTTVERNILYASSGVYYVQNNYSGTSQLLNTSTDALAGSGDNKIAFSIKNSDLKLVGNNGTVRNNTSVTMPLFDYLQLGIGYGTPYLNGHIKKMTYWNSALSGSALQLMTGDE